MKSTSSIDVSRYREQGFLMPSDTMFEEQEFGRLKDHFEQKLRRLPPEIRPEAMDVPHFTDTTLFEWLFDDHVLSLVEPLIGPDIALFSSHFICKPQGNGKRVPWHEDSHYWKGLLDRVEVVTVWLAIDPSTLENGCMKVIPRSHGNGFSDYEPVDLATNVFAKEIRKDQFDAAGAIAIELEPNHCSLHDGRLIHGSDANHSKVRRCGYTMRYMPSTVRFNHERYGDSHQIYLARGRDRAGNVYADPAKAYPQKARYRELNSRNFH